MPMISKCPKCQQQVTIPAGVDPEAEVRCPLCAVVYPLRDAIAEAPPALIPVETDTIIPATSDSGAALASDLISEPFHVPEPDEAPASPQAEVEAETESPAEERPDFDFMEMVDESPKIDTGVADTEEDLEEPDAFAIVEEEEDEPQFEPIDGTPSKKRRKKKRKEKNVFKEMVGAVLGGFLGLALGYYLLNFFGGSRFDFIDVYLPGVEHTYQHWAGAEKGPAMKSEADQPNTQPPAPEVDPARADTEMELTDFEPPVAESSTPDPLGLEPPTIDLEPQPIVTPEPILEPGPLAQPESPAPPETITEPESILEPELIIEPAPATELEAGAGPELVTEPAPVTEAESTTALESVEEGEPEPLPSDGVGPRKHPSFPLDELDTALKAALDALDAADATGPMTPDVYQKFCRLGHVVTFVEGDAGTQKQSVRTLLETAGQPEVIGSLAGEMLENNDRAKEGILLCGTVRAVAFKGELHGAAVKLPEPHKVVMVMSRNSLAVEKQDKVLVLGSIITEPAENLAGYTGTQALVVWATEAVKLPP